jgi:hypothetical protein
MSAIAREMKSSASCRLGGGVALIGETREMKTKSIELKKAPQWLKLSKLARYNR